MSETATVMTPQRTARAHVERLAVRDFRNLAPMDVALPADGLALVGENGHGKTNFLEAIYYLQILRSFRGARDVDLVRFGAPGFHIAAALGDASARELAVGFERQTRRKKVTLDGGEPSRLADAIGAFPAVIFSPADAELVAGAPSERRRFLDVMLSLTSRAYLSALQRYRAALARRNAALRDAAGGRADSAIDVWEPTLAEAGAILSRSRRTWVRTHADTFASLCLAIGEQGRSTLRYVSALDCDDDEIEEGLREALARRRTLDLQRGMTHAGPHRDDVELTLQNRDLRTFGSAGQQRTAAIALRLLEASTLRAAAGAEPIVLLDDPFAELDQRRTAHILQLLQGDGRGQTILAVPRATDIPPDLTRLDRWRVQDGQLGAKS
ncbi:MAG TPA: DNA replication and repair protein RecF [Gemmatimonadaceae bacterium]|nr:DNA replication and repair protein RecF [Gemmatimonadaceae bacterium]